MSKDVGRKAATVLQLLLILQTATAVETTYMLGNKFPLPGGSSVGYPLVSYDLVSGASTLPFPPGRRRVVPLA